MELSTDDRSLMEEAAQGVVKRRLSVPAMMFLETVSPMNTLASSMLHMITPIWGMVLSADRIKQLARLLEERDAIPELIKIIDEAEETRRAEERVDRDARKAERKALKERRRQEKLNRKQKQGTRP